MSDFSCPYCARLAKEWEKAASALYSMVNLGVVNVIADMKVYEEIAYRFSEGVPLVVMYKSQHGKVLGMEYNGNQKARDLIKWTEDVTKQSAKSYESKLSTSSAEMFHQGRCL